MRLDFSKLSAPLLKPVGHQGTGGTANADALSLSPTIVNSMLDKMGQTAFAQIEHHCDDDKTVQLSHLQHNEVGQANLSIHAAVPLAPFVPQKYLIDPEAFEERAAILEFHCGMSCADAELRAFELLAGEQANGRNLSWQ